MKNFKLVNPANLQELFQHCAEKGSSGRLIAGGTDLIPAFKKEKCEVPEYMISLKAVPELAQIKKEQNQVSVGSMVTHGEITESPVISENAFVLSEACDKVASWQIRNLATIGGNLANASPAADSAPALLVLDADIHLAGANGSRTLKLSEFFTGPGCTVLAEGEIIEKISFAPLGSNEGAAFVKLGKRKAVTLSIVSAAAYVKMNSAHTAVEEIRIAMGSVAPTPVRLFEAEKLFKGQQPEAVSRESLHQAVRSDIKPIKDARSTAEYRLEVSGVIVARAVKEAVLRAAEAGKGGRK